MRFYRISTIDELIVLHKLLDVIRMVWYAVFADEAAAILCYEHIVLDTYAAKVFVALEHVEVEEFGTMSRCFPVVDKGWDEVDARLVGYDKALFEAAAHTQAVGAKLVEAWTCLGVEANVYLVERLHIVNVHTHHMSQSVG